MAKPKPSSLSKLFEKAYAEGYGDAQRDTQSYWEYPSLHHTRRYIAKKLAVVTALVKEHKRGE